MKQSHPSDTNERRKKQLEAWKPRPPSNNGWWFYEYFRNILSGDKRNDIR